MNAYSGIGVVCLAAGLSARMGERNKLLLPIKGEPLIRRTARLYCDLSMAVTVVLGHEGEAIGQALVGLPVEFVPNENYRDGQQSSVRAGLEACALPRDGLLIALGDLPLLDKADIVGLCEAFLRSGRDKVFVPYYRESRGNPVLLPTSLVAQMRGGEQQSVRRFIDANPERVQSFEAPNTHFTTDVDSTEDFERISAMIEPDKQI